MSEGFNTLKEKLEMLEKEFEFQTNSADSEDKKSIQIDELFDDSDEDDEEEIYDEDEIADDFSYERYVNDEKDPFLSFNGQNVDNYTLLGKTEEEKKIEFNGQISDEDIEHYSYLLYPQKKVMRSLLLDVFTTEQIIELYKISDTLSVSNNQKMEIIKETLNEWGIKNIPLGTGTNRYGFSTDGYVVKVASDEDGKIDNKREFIYSMELQPDVIKCYEITPDGLIGVFEYVQAFSMDDLWQQSENMRKILRRIGRNYLIGDVGITSKNYGNWGFRNDGSCVILDYAYIYSVAFKHFNCPTCGPDSLLYYDRDFVNFICPRCNKSYKFSDLRRRISRAEQDAEIGDVTKKGYVITKPEQEVKFQAKFTMGASASISDFLIKREKKERMKEEGASNKYKQLLKTAGKEETTAEEIIKMINRNGGI